LERSVDRSDKGLYRGHGGPWGVGDRDSVKKVVQGMRNLVLESVAPAAVPDALALCHNNPDATADGNNDDNAEANRDVAVTIGEDGVRRNVTYQRTRMATHSELQDLKKETWRALGKVRSDATGLSGRVDDVSLQSRKCCVVFKGRQAVATLLPGSDFQKLRHLVAKFWKVSLTEADVGQVHYTPDKGLVAKFIQLKHGSTFHSITTRLPTWPEGEASIFARQQVGAAEARVAFVAKLMKREGEIRDYRPNTISGKIEVLLLRGRWRTLLTVQSILRLASRNVCRMVQDSDARRAKAKK
jgi:hypothetical protein